MPNTKTMKIKTRVYYVQLVEVGKKKKGEPKKKELLQLEDLGLDETQWNEVSPNADLSIIATQIGIDNQTHEKMMMAIKKVGDKFKLKVKILTQ